MLLLLDTHVVVWLISGELHRLRAPVADGLLSALGQGRAAVSAASFWELALKQRKRPARLSPLRRSALNHWRPWSGDLPQRGRASREHSAASRPHQFRSPRHPRHLT